LTEKFFAIKRPKSQPSESQASYKRVTSETQESYKRVTRELQASYKRVTRDSQESRERMSSECKCKCKCRAAMPKIDKKVTFYFPRVRPDTPIPMPKIKKTAEVPMPKIKKMAEVPMPKIKKTAAVPMPKVGKSAVISEEQTKAEININPRKNNCILVTRMNDNYIEILGDQDANLKRKYDDIAQEENGLNNNWIIRVGDGDNFMKSSKINVWGIPDNSNASVCFINNVKKGDVLWFITSNSGGKIIAVATYEEMLCVIPTPNKFMNSSKNALMDNLSIEDFTYKQDVPNMLMKYKDLYVLSEIDHPELLTCMKSIRMMSIYKYRGIEDNHCKVDLDMEYIIISLRMNRENLKHFKKK